MEEFKLTIEDFFAFDKSEITGLFLLDTGDKFWFKEGKRHRLDGPAFEPMTGNKFWYKEGKRHRLDGPAIEYSDGSKSWWIEGKQYTEEEWKRLSFAILNNLEVFL